MSKKRWWGSHSIATEQSARLIIGPMTLWIHRGVHEWRVAYEKGHDPLDDHYLVEIPSQETIPETQDMVVNRFAFRKMQEPISLVPALADRAMVISPASPFQLLPTEEVTLYVSTALWVQINARDTLLLEESLFRPSDTWFGQTTMNGELCYASKTSARLDLENVPRRPHRVISAVRVVNRAQSKLILQHLKIPMRLLSIFEDETAGLWTEQLSLERQEDGDIAAVQLSKTPPKEAGETKRVSKPREGAAKGLLLEAFGGFFSRKGGESS